MSAASVNPDILAGAAHEIGHALVNQAGGLTVTHVTLNRRTGIGLCHLKEFDETDPRLLRAWLVGCLAGFEAEDRFLRKHRLGHAHRDSSRTDFRNFRQHARTIGLSEGAARARARSHLDWHWGRLERLVPKLAEHGRLSP